VNRRGGTTRETGFGRSCGCARGRVGCRSRRAALGPCRKVMGLAPWLPFAGARGAKARRKPDRGGESHQHASSDTGGGLLVNPRCRRRAWRHANADCASGEGALGDGRRPGPANAAVFDETAAEAGPATRSDGDAVSRPHLPRVVTEDVRGYVASPARGRKHRAREVKRGGADDRGSARTALHSTRQRQELKAPAVPSGQA